MITLVMISLALFIIGAALITVYFYSYAKDWLFAVGITLMIIGGVSSIVFGILSANHTKAIKEYPASEYTLSYKITEFEGQRDTTYILIPKEK